MYERFFMRLNRIKKIPEIIEMNRHIQDTAAHAKMTDFVPIVVPGSAKSIVERMESKLADCGYRTSANPAGKKLPSVGNNSAVLMVEVYISVPRSVKTENPYFNVSDFCSLSMQWMCEEFLASNIVSAAYHESARTPHIHALMFPVTPDYRWSAWSMIGGRSRLREHQDCLSCFLAQLRIVRPNSILDYENSLNPDD